MQVAVQRNRQLLLLDLIIHKSISVVCRESSQLNRVSLRLTSRPVGSTNKCCSGPKEAAHRRPERQNHGKRELDGL